MNVFIINSCVKIIQRNFSTVSKLYFQLSIPVHVLTIHEHTYDYPDFYNHYLLLCMIHTCKHGQKPRNSIQLKIRIEYYHNKKFTGRYRILFMIQTFINTTYGTWNRTICHIIIIDCRACNKMIVTKHIINLTSGINPIPSKWLLSSGSWNVIKWENTARYSEIYISVV